VRSEPQRATDRRRRANGWAGCSYEQVCRGPRWRVPSHPAVGSRGGLARRMVRSGAVRRTISVSATRRAVTRAEAVEDQGDVDEFLGGVLMDDLPSASTNAPTTDQRAPPSCRRGPAGGPQGFRRLLSVAANHRSRFPGGGDAAVVVEDGGDPARRWPTSPWSGSWLAQRTLGTVGDDGADAAGRWLPPGWGQVCDRATATGRALRRSGSVRRLGSRRLVRRR
jgi:hypothetical protein